MGCRLAHPWLSMDTQRDVVELVDAFVKLKMLHRYLLRVVH